MKKYIMILFALATMFSASSVFAKSTKHRKPRHSTPCNTMATASVHHNKRHSKGIVRHHATRKRPTEYRQETIVVDDRYGTAIVSIKNGNVYINDSFVTTVKDPKNEDHRLIINYTTPPAQAVIEHEKVNVYTGEKTQSMLGVLGADDDEMDGVFVDEILPCGPAAKAGLYPGDVITKVNDQDIKNGDDLRSAMGTLNPGDVVAVTIRDFDGTETKKVELTKKEEPTSCGCHMPFACRRW